MLNTIKYKRTAVIELIDCRSYDDFVFNSIIIKRDQL